MTKHMEEIKQLRERTGAGIVDCKAALTEAGGDIEKAIEILRKKGIAKAAKRADRETKAGVILVSVTDDAKAGYVLELNAETDFVVRNDKFKQLGDKTLAAILVNKPTSLEEVLNLKLEDGATIGESWQHLSGVIGEKMGLNRYDCLTSAGTVAGYAHPQGNIGVLVALSNANATDLARDIAMHIAAASPRYVNSTEVDPAEMEKEKEIYREQLKKENKPAEMVEKILLGKMNKFYEEVCLMDQEYIKDDKKRVKEILAGSTIEKFIRYQL
jgi:elongation factor Ts